MPDIAVICRTTVSEAVGKKREAGVWTDRANISRTTGREKPPKRNNGACVE